MFSAINIVLPSANQMRQYAQTLLTGISPESFSRKPVFSGVVLEMNHPGFAYGHLAIYPGTVLELLNMPFKDARAPEIYYELFRNGSPCHDDIDGSRYPGMDQIVAAFSNAYDILFERIPEISPEALNEVTPGERVNRFPVKGAFLVHLITSHIASHLGQVSAWRRAMQLPPA